MDDPQSACNSLSVPLINCLDIPKDHSIFAVTEIVRHGNFMIFFIFRFIHVLNVLATVLEVTDIHPFGVEKLLESKLALTNGLLLRVGGDHASGIGA